MKKPLFLAVVFVTGLASIALAQFSENQNVNHTTTGYLKSYDFAVQDTTKKPVTDTLAPKTDSIPAKKDSSSINF